MELQRVHTDDRGGIYSITSELFESPEVAILHTKAGYARGGCIHHENSEHLCVLEGLIEYVYGDKTVRLSTGQSITIGKSVPHYFTSVTDSVVAEWGPKPEEKQAKHDEFRKIVLDINAKLK